MSFDPAPERRAARAAEPRLGPLVAAPCLASAFSAETEEAFVAEARRVRPTHFYSRYGNPTVRAFEDAVARLEGAQAAIGTPSGLAAISLAVVGLRQPAGRIVIPRAVYAGARALTKRLATSMGAELIVVDATDEGAFGKAVRPRDLVVLETPANPLMEITDLARIAAICRSTGATTVVDNTAAVLNQQPLSLGCDVVVHSVTKTISGHGDVTAGVVCGDLPTIERLWDVAHLQGCVMDPFAAWLASRGLQTLALRVARQNHTAMILASRLAEHPGVVRVFYPGHLEHPGHVVARSQMSGFGGLVSFTLRGGEPAAKKFISRRGRLRLSASFGQHATLVVRPAAMWAGDALDATAAELPEGLIRLGIGLEEPDEIWGDVQAGLRP